MSTPLTVEVLLDLVERSTTTIELPTTDTRAEWQRAGGERFEVVDSKSLIEGLQAIINAQPSVLFASLIGLTVVEANESLDARSPYEKGLHPISELVVSIEDGQMTDALMERLARVRGTSGMFDGRGLILPGELPVTVTDGVITEILNLTR